MAIRPKGLRATSHGVSPPSSTERIEQRVVFVGITVRPAVHRNRSDVAGGIESAGPSVRANWSRILRSMVSNVVVNSSMRPSGVLVAGGPAR